MNDDPANAPESPKCHRRGRTIALICAGLAAGAIGATAIGANAQSSSAPTTPSAKSSAASSPGAPGDSAGAPGGPGQGPAGAHGGAAPVRSDEKSVSASVAATLKAAALKAVPGSTVYRVETDAGDGDYEAHLTKADGALATVKFDKALKVIKVETGMGTGDHPR